MDVVQANKKDIKLRGVEDRKAETGSSISTALAAGLAALVLWFVVIGAKYSWDENQGRFGGDGLDANDVKAIQNVRAMKQAFKKLGASRESNEKFIEIWSVLDDRARPLKDLHGDLNVKPARQVTSWLTISSSRASAQMPADYQREANTINHIYGRGQYVAKIAYMILRKRPWVAYPGSCLT
ncbi:hypothetical protein EYB25_009338 [Talaromyces marneffei]|nr:hypothetical protein EYB25_009338 [Talaromyces marneffei]